jgi:hypothetical protein
MWPREFRVFKVSPELTEVAQQARDSSRREDDLPRLDLTAASLPDPCKTLDHKLAQQAIGERFLSLLEGLAISSGCAPAKLPILMGDHNFAPDVRSGVAEYFGLASGGKAFERFISMLAVEFYRWVTSHPKERRDFGLELDPQGHVFLECPDLRPDLEPLGD